MQRDAKSMLELSVVLVGAVLIGLLYLYWRSGSRPAVADVRLRIFEVEADVADRIVPSSTRRVISGSAYSIAAVSPDDVNALLDGMLTDSGLLLDRSQRFSQWPMRADTWAYTRATPAVTGAGSGCGTLGVRRRRGVPQIRLDYTVTHTANTREPIEGKVAYEGDAPLHSALVALRPFERIDGSRAVHVLVFETSNWR